MLITQLTEEHSVFGVRTPRLFFALDHIMDWITPLAVLVNATKMS